MRCQPQDGTWDRHAMHAMLDAAERARGQPLDRELTATLRLSFHKLKPTEAKAKAKAKRQA